MALSLVQFPTPSFLSVVISHLLCSKFGILLAFAAVGEGR